LVLSAAIACGLALSGCTARAADAFKFSDITGWWSAEPSYAGESSRVLLHFMEENGEQSVRISLLDIGGYDVPIGTVTIAGDTLDMQPYPFPLQYDAAKGTLSGELPEAAVPVNKIPIEFHRIEPMAKPVLPTWDAPRPRTEWTFDTKAAVWAAIERDPASGDLFVGNDAGTLHALERSGALRWKFETGNPIKARPAVIGDAVYVASDSGFLHKLDKRSGTQRWQARIDTGSPERLPVSEEMSRWDRRDRGEEGRVGLRHRTADRRRRGVRGRSRRAHPCAALNARHREHTCGGLRHNERHGKYKDNITWVYRSRALC
jgi:outer membrane protein assembly factor BamB